MITDSFGSPSLGQGIALQAQPKDYSGQIIKGIVAGQERKAKAEQKKLDKDLQDQEKLDKELARLNATAGIPAFTPRYKEEGLKVLNVIEKLKNENKPILTNPEFLKAKFEFQQNMDKIRFEEDEIKRQITGFGKDPNNEEYDYDYFNALWDETGKSLSAINPEGKPTIVSGRQFIKKLPQYNFEKDWKDAVKKVTPSTGKGYTETITPQGIPVLQFDEKTTYSPEEIQRTWDEFKLQPSVRNRVKNNAIASGKTEQEAEKQLEDQFKALFKLETKKTTATQIRTDNYVPGSGIDVLRNLKVSIGTLDPSIPFEQSMDKYYKENSARKMRETLLELYNSDPSKYKDKIYYMDGSVKRVLSPNTPLSKIEEIVKNYNKTAKAPLEMYTKEAAKQELDPLLSYKDTLVGFQVSDKGKQNPFIKAFIGDNNKPITGSPMGIVKVGGDYRFLINQEFLDKDGKKQYGFTTVPIEQNSVAVSTYLNPKAQDVTEQNWIDFYEEKIKLVPKKEQGGLVEPKTVSQKFHNKSKNMTKFVYSDGSEEIFNGII